MKDYINNGIKIGLIIGFFYCIIRIIMIFSKVSPIYLSFINLFLIPLSFFTGLLFKYNSFLYISFLNYKTISIVAITSLNILLSIFQWIVIFYIIHLVRRRSSKFKNNIIEE